MDPRLELLNLKTSLSAIADLVLPRVCVVCGRPLLAQERHICVSCLADIPETHFSSCIHNPMADRFNKMIDSENYEPYAYATALFHYREDSDFCRITQALKYAGNLKAGRYFSRMLGRRLSESGVFRGVDLVLPVPLHWLRAWKRGYNQAEVIAKLLADELDAQLDCSLLYRSRNTTTQTRLSGADKRSNVQGAFALRRGSLARFKEPPSHILLVDDVFTSGSTLSSCHAALRLHFGPETRISVATLAFVG